MRSRSVQILAGIVFHAEISLFSVFQKIRFVTKSNERCCKKIRMKSNQLDKRDIFRKNSLTMWYQNVQDIPCLTCSWCTQHWRQNINMHNFSGGSLAGKGKNARVSSNRWYLHACNSLRLRFLLQQRLLFPAFTSAMSAKQLWNRENYTLFKRPI